MLFERYCQDKRQATDCEKIFAKKKPQKHLIKDGYPNKEHVKLSLFADVIILYIEIPKDSIKKLKLINDSVSFRI